MGCVGVGTVLSSERTYGALHAFPAGHVEPALLEFPPALVEHALCGAKTSARLPAVPVLAAAVFAPPRVLLPLLRAPPCAAVVALGVVARPRRALHVATAVLHGVPLG